MAIIIRRVKLSGRHNTRERVPGVCVCVHLAVADRCRKIRARYSAIIDLLSAGTESAATDVSFVVSPAEFVAD